jgi:hypothetical protein
MIGIIGSDQGNPLFSENKSGKFWLQKALERRFCGKNRRFNEKLSRRREASRR